MCSQDYSDFNRFISNNSEKIYIYSLFIINLVKKLNIPHSKYCQTHDNKVGYQHLPPGSMVQKQLSKPT